MTDEGDSVKRVRLPTMPGGQAHFAQAREDDVEGTNRAIAAAIAKLEAVEGAQGYPSVDRLRSVSGNAFGRSTAYRVMEQVHAAQEAWRERERRAGREIPAKLQASLPCDVQSAAPNSAKALEKAEAAFNGTKAKLVRALEAVEEERATARKAKQREADTDRINARLLKGIYDKIWGEIEATACAALPKKKGRQPSGVASHAKPK